MAKKDKQADMPDLQRDDALFETLGKNKKRKRRKIIITVVSIVLVLAIIAAVGVSFLQRRVREQFASSQGEVLSYEVTTGSISTVVSGSGSLTDVDLESITVPEGVEITEVKVKRNQAITTGDILATVDMASVISAMADLQVQIEELDAEISDAEDDAASTTIYAGATGRVKAIFGEAEASVADVMYEHGALALISLDGYMAVDIESDTLKAGDAVTVKLSDEEEITGTVESQVGGKATILTTDNGPKYDEAVTVLNSEGTQVGTGNLYIHSALRVTGYAGTIASVKVDENDKVSDTTKLFTLQDTGYSANYNSLLRDRADLEETLLELLTIQRDGAVLAKMDGSVYSVDYSEDTEAEDTATAVATLSADEKMSVTINVDESDILSLELGQTVTVTVKSVSEDESFAGTLTEINRTSSSSGTYSAVIEVEKVPGMLSGMTASVSVRIEGVDDAILIPIEALHKTSDGAYVYTSYNEEYQEYGGKVDVVTGLENSTYVEIKSGLNVGDTVYYTEQESGFSFGNMPGGFGNMSSGNSGGFPGSNGGQMPDFGNMPSGGNNRPSGGGNRPGGSGNFPGGFGG
ncbi:MAG: HlyD family efflux transporter periplasmic adaptor subunit [Oscillospiraceae bacterium]|nr:HlyD family efflux transporter periplasmic adaptor subunit [Oscillospiraceae bacterium]